MAYLLSGSTIKAPQDMAEVNSSQFAQNRVLSGAIARDFFGSNKRSWILKYRNIKKSDYDTINTVYQSYLTNGTVKTWQVTETNYTVASTNVHVDLVERGFNVGGEDYLSNFDLVLTEA